MPFTEQGFLQNDEFNLFPVAEGPSATGRVNLWPSYLLEGAGIPS